MPIRYLIFLLFAFPVISYPAQAQMPVASDPDTRSATGRVNNVEVELDTSTTRLSENGKFQVTARSQHDLLQINKMHAWIVHVQDVSGRSINNANMTVTGGMPEHNHGLPTAPRFTKNQGSGNYLLEGVRFNMSGWWELRFSIDANGVTDTAVFNVVLPN